MSALLRYLVLPLALLAALAAAWLWLAWHWSYSSGERAGWVQQFSKRGWICKTWEGELALVSLPGSTTEKFFFTVHDDAVAARISRLMGKRVSLHFEEKVGLPTSCFGETRYFVTGATEAEEIPLGPGVVLPSPATSAAAAAAAASASEAAAAATSAASR